jgi:hypothetical protein
VFYWGRTRDSVTGELRDIACFDTNGKLTLTVKTLTLTNLTSNRLPKVSSSSGLTDSLLSDNGTTLTYTGTAGVSAASFTASGSGPAILKGTEGACAGGESGKDVLCLGDATGHRVQVSNNGGAFSNVLVASDFFGSSPGTKAVTTALASDPTANNCVKWVAGGQLGDAGAACGSGGGSTSWSSLTNAGAALSLSNADWATTFNQTSAVTWTWANTTAATSSVAQFSPYVKLSGQYWNGTASAEDYWTIQNTIGTGANPSVTLNFAHTGSSGTAWVAVPNLSASGTKLTGSYITRTAAADGLIIRSGSSSYNGNQGTLTLYGGDTGGTNYAGGAAILRGGNSTATGTGSGGNLTISAGYADGASGQVQGTLVIQQPYRKGATVTANYVACFSGNETVANCGTSAVNPLGVITTINTYSVLIATHGKVTVAYDGTYSPSAGWFACTSASVGGTVTPQSAACSAGREVGIVTAGGTSVTSGTVQLTWR